MGFVIDKTSPLISRTLTTGAPTFSAGRVRALLRRGAATERGVYVGNDTLSIPCSIESSVKYIDFHDDTE
jgi:hypothetical protein